MVEKVVVSDEEEKKEEIEKKVTKKRGRKPKNFKEEYSLNKEQTKFFVDLSKDNENLEKIFRLLEEANKKEFGKEITFKELALYGINKLTKKDLEKIQENSYSKMEKVHKLLAEYNQKHGTALELGEFLVKKLSIS